MIALAGSAQASWYWPFGSNAGDEKPLRISELMEPASLLIDEAADLAAEGKVNESVEKYRKALEELDRIERENPERAKSTEFATLRNKRAYVNAAIDSMLLGQVKANARAVAVSDTTELEKKLAAEKAAREQPPKAPEAEAEKPVQPKTVQKSKSEEKPERVVNQAAASTAVKPASNRDRAMAAIAQGDYATAASLIDVMLREKPNGAVALNLRAVMEAKQGDFRAAEATLDQAIMSNPRNHFAYYNMANLMLQVNPDGKRIAKRYYDTGRDVGGPVDERLEAALK